MRITLIIKCIIVLAISGQAFAQQPFKIVGYYGIDAALQGTKRTAIKRLTHINLWFLNPDSLGNFSADLTALKPFIAKAHKKNIKVLFSIGGGSKHPQYLYLLNDENRAKLIAGFIDQVERYNADGIDVDLEGSDIGGYYEKFVVELGQALHAKNKLMTAAIAIYYKEQFTDLALQQYDFMNVMSYDRTGPWRPDKPGPHSTYTHASEDLEYFNGERGIPKEKLTLGVPFYGYGYGPELMSPAISKSYKDIVKMFKDAEYEDEWKMPDGKIIYYNGIPTIKLKTMLAKERASGIMIWQVLGDAPRGKSLLKAIHDSAK